jgi:hypothetical protein
MKDKFPVPLPQLETPGQPLHSTTTHQVAEARQVLIRLLFLGVLQQPIIDGIQIHNPRLDVVGMAGKGVLVRLHLAAKSFEAVFPVGTTKV